MRLTIYPARLLLLVNSFAICKRQTSSFAQSIKVLLLIAIIIGLFWMYNNRDTSKPMDTAVEEVVPTTSVNNAKANDPTKLPSTNSSIEGAVTTDQSNSTIEESVYTENEVDFQMIDSSDPSEIDLGGIDSIPTEEEREELMKFAPGTDETGVIPEPPETGDIGVYGDAPETDDSDIIAISPEDSLAQ